MAHFSLLFDAFRFLRNVIRFLPSFPGFLEILIRIKVSYRMKDLPFKQ